jgi:putative DNA methylase
MFSNHILKPERLPLENSVWGTDRSSGTFASLFESRLIRAKQYLDAPFELTVDKDLLGGATSSAKVIASHPIAARIVDNWDQLKREPSGALLLNGDSATLPVPNESVDAVITDPPYFDFVHYSELSDFFFAWLSPVLGGTYPWFSKSDSSDPGEVQQKDPRTFAAQLSRVFSEAARVLKPDGLLAFSFHHSRPEGWAAIQEALAEAGLEIVHAHPVHAELKAANPKSAAKDPISLDAILVCRKLCVGFRERTSLDVAVDRAFARGELLRRAGITMSDADYFVVAAAYVLAHATDWPGAFDRTVAALSQAKALCGARLAVARTCTPDDEHRRSASPSLVGA